MTPVRSKRSDLVHASYDLRRTGCGRKCDGWAVAPDQAVTCVACVRVEREIEEHGN